MGKETEVEKSNKKTAFDAARENLWHLNPDDIIIVGYDTNDGLEHPLVNERVLKMKREGFNHPHLADSLLADGQQQNIVVRKNGSKIECVVGRNRVLAGRAIRRRQEDAGQPATFILRSVLRKENEAGALMRAVAAENGPRLADDMLTKAREASRMLNAGQTKRDVARVMGMTEEVLANHLRVLELSPKMQSAVERGVITATAAATFADLSLEEQDARIVSAEEQGLIISVPEARRQRAARSEAKKSGKPKPEGETRTKGVPISILRKVYDDEEFAEGLSPDAKKLLRWVIGAGSPRHVAGLNAALQRVTGKSHDE